MAKRRTKASQRRSDAWHRSQREYLWAGASLAVEHLFERVHILKKDSTAGCVIHGTTMIDELLKKLLETFFWIRNPKLDAVLFANFAGEKGPLSTLWARNECCFHLGLLGEKMRDAIDCLRKLRNDYAHSESDPPLQLSKITLIENTCPVIREFIDKAPPNWSKHGDKKVSPSAARLRFMDAIYSLSLLLNFSIVAVMRNRKVLTY